MYRDKETLSFELMDEAYAYDFDEPEELADDEPADEPEEFEADYTPAELAAAQERTWADDLKLYGYRRTTIVQPSEQRRLEALVAAGATIREEIAAINADAKRIRDIRLEFAAEMAALDARQMPHASDCRFWVDEPCDCLTGKPDYTFQEAA